MTQASDGGSASDNCQVCGHPRSSHDEDGCHECACPGFIDDDEG